MPPKTAKEKIEAEIRRLSKLEGNKTCVDCNEKMPTYIDMTNKTFVCQKCSVIHREMQHKVKGISMTVFSQEDVNEISRGGNNVFNRQYMARHTSKDIHASSTDLIKLKDFIQQKYSFKRWFSEDGSPDPPIQESRKLGTSISKSVAAPMVDLLNFDVNSPAATPRVDDPFGSQSVSSIQSAPPGDPFGPVNMSSATHSTFFDPFGKNLARIEPDSVAAPVSSQPFDPFGSSSVVAPAAASFDPFGASAAPAQHAGGFAPFAGANDGFAPSTAGFAPSAAGFAATAPAPPGFSSSSPVAMPFIQLMRPATDTPAPEPAPAAAPTPAPAPRLPGFSAFDDINPPLVAQSAGNPFDAQAHGAYPPGYPGYPPGYPPYGAPPGYPPVAGYPPVGYPAAPPGYPGYPGYPPAPGGPPGYPPQGYPPGPGAPQGYPQGYPPQGYPPQGYPPQGYPPQGYPPQGYPPQSNPGGPSTVAAPAPVATPSTNNPFATFAEVPPVIAPVPAPVSVPAPVPVEAKAPDPFSSMTEMGWSNVSKPAPPKTMSPLPASSPPVYSTSPVFAPPQQTDLFDMGGMSEALPPAHQSVSVNLFDAPQHASVPQQQYNPEPQQHQPQQQQQQQQQHQEYFSQQQQQHSPQQQPQQQQQQQQYPPKSQQQYPSQQYAPAQSYSASPFDSLNAPPQAAPTPVSAPAPAASLNPFDMF